MSFSLSNILEILIIYQALIFVLFLAFDKRSKPLFIKALIVFCVLIILHFTYMLLEDKVLNDTIFLGPFFGLLYGPIYFVYTKSLMVTNIRIKTYAIHFIAPCIMLLLLIIFSKELFEIMPVVGLIVTLHFIGYLWASLSSIFRFRKQLQYELSSFIHINLNWLEIIIYIQLVTLCITLLESYFQSKSTSDVLILLILLLVLVIINCFYYLGLKQVRLYKGLSVETNSTSTTSEYTISEDLFNTYSKKLTQYISIEKPYLEFDLSLDDLSGALEISKRNLSHIINRNFNTNFYDFINQFRLKVAKDELIESNKAIKEVMYNSGFSNKASFNAIFKKNTGLTPTQFRQKKKS